ncbi:MAG: hypothetical protein R3C39_14875 [Dehalococcoidia bacterium]
MRLKPPVSEGEALEFLKGQAKLVWGIDVTPEIEAQLKSMAEAMADVSAAPIPEAAEPLLL